MGGLCPVSGLTSGRSRISTPSTGPRLATILSDCTQVGLRDSMTAARCSIVSTLESAGRAITQTLFGALTDSLWDKLRNSTVWKTISDFLLDVFGGIAHAVLGLFGGIGESIAGALGVGGNAASTAAGAATSAAGTAGSAASTASSVAGAASGVVGIVGAVGSIGTMISSIIGNFQSAKMETTLNAIEESTRRTQIGINEGQGVLNRLNTYLPYLAGIETMLRDVVATGVADVKDEVIAKGNAIVSAVNASKDVLIQAKDYIHDMALDIVDVVAAGVGSKNLLQSIKDVLDAIKTSMFGTEANTARFSTLTLEGLVSSLTTDLSGKLTTVANNVSGITSNMGSAFTTALSPVTSGIVNLQNAIRDIDPDATFANVISGLQINLVNKIGEINPNGYLFNVQNTLSSYLNTINSSLITISNTSTRVQPPNQTIQNVYINGVQQASLAGALRSQGVLF